MLVSEGNHTVSRYGDWFAKSPRAGEEQSLALEHSANLALGRESRLDSAGILHSACLGEPIADPPGEAMVIDGADFACHASRQVDEVFSSRMPPLHMSERELLAKLVSKMSDHPAVVAWSVPHLRAVNLDADVSPGLNHPDPHPGNWVLSDAGDLVLIDWEWPVWGSAAVGRGCLLSALLFSQDVPRGSVMDFASRLDDAALSWFRGKAVASVGWTYRRFGLARASERMRRVDDFLGELASLSASAQTAKGTSNPAAV